MKPTREEAERMIGKRTPLPQGRGAGALNDLPKEKTESAAPSSMGNLADPLGLKKNLRKRMEEVDKYRCGGVVKKKSGGVVRGCGAAVKGKTKAKMY